MKSPCLILLFALSNLLAVSAQDLGFFSIINATGSPLEIAVDGKPFPQPIPANVATGGVGFEVGSHTLRLSHEEHGSVSLNLNLVKETSPIVVIYLEQEKRGEDVKHNLKAETVINTSTEENALQVRAVYFGPEPRLSVRVDTKDTLLQKGKPETIAKGSFPQIAVGDQVVLQMDVEERTNWLVAITEAPDGTFVAIPIFDLVYR